MGRLSFSALLASRSVHNPRRYAGARGATTLALAVALTMTIPASPTYAAGDPLAEAQAKITAAQEAADRATAAFDAAQTRYYGLEQEVGVARKTVALLRADQQHLAAIVGQRAVTLYMRAGSTNVDMFRASGDVLDASRRVTLAAAANAGGDVAIGQLRAATEDLDVREAALRSQLADARKALDDVRSQQQALQRSVDDAKRAEQELRVRLERERRANEYATLVQQAQEKARSAQIADASGNASADGGSSAPGQIIGSGSWVCPVQGGVSFTDTFGAPRVGGRTHKGVDMFAARGTPLVAVVAGSVFFQSDTLGGLAAYVEGNDGNTYYYAHLNDYVGGGRSVSAGELIGHVGNTGDADGGPSHLHFEIRPGGPNGLAIDPTPTVRAHC
jgi:peptidoglycan LD-endopeptidase LytH